MFFWWCKDTEKYDMVVHKNTKGVEKITPSAKITNKKEIMSYAHLIKEMN